MSETNRKKLEETLIPDSYHISIFESGTQDVGAEFVPGIYRFITLGLADAIKSVRDKDKPAAVVIRDMKTAILFGVRIEFIKGEDDESGSWNTVWSFNPDDFDDCSKYDAESPVMEPFFINRATACHLKLYPGSTYTLQRTAIQVLTDWLDKNALPDGTVEVELDNIFVAEVQVKNGVKIFNFIPSEEVTNICKSDADISAM